MGVSRHWLELIRIAAGPGLIGSRRASFLRRSELSDTILTFSRKMFTCHYEWGQGRGEQGQRTGQRGVKNRRRAFRTKALGQKSNLAEK